MKATTRSVEPIDVLDHRPSLVWISPGQSLVGFGEVARFPAGTGPERFDRVDTVFREWTETIDVDDRVSMPGTGPVAFASFTFDDRSHGSELVVPEVVLGTIGSTSFATTFDDADISRYFHPVATADPEVDRPRYAGASTPDVAYLDAVATAVASIEAGDLRKVVLARDHAVWSKLRFDVGRVLRRLIHEYPTCHIFAVDGLVGASPELLVRRMGSTIESVVLAGTAPRSSDPEEDARLAEGLLNSEKDLREHDWAASPVQAVLTGLSQRIFRSPTPELMELANLRHLSTRFRGTLASDITAIQIAGRLHPTGAVGGFPTAEAVEMIRALEGMDRGRYAGPVGWMDHHGDGELAIALRCAEISGARARLFAGAGIVAGSLPENELEETRLKLAAMLDALGG